MRREQVIVVGAGPAGVAAAVQCRRLGIVPICIDRTGRGGGLAENAHSIENYPALPHPIGGPAFADMLRKDLDRFGLAVRKARAVRVRPEETGFAVEAEHGVLRSRAVILATGTEPNRLEIPGGDDLDGESVFYDVRSLLIRHPKPRRIVVIGGGEAACDYSLTLASIGAAVTLVVRSPALRARGALAVAVRESGAVDVRCDTTCEGISRRRPFAVRLRESVTPESAERRADALLVAVGRHSAAPRLLGLPDGAAADRLAGLPAGLFVAGDARTGSLGQIGMAVGEGLSAATAAARFLEDA